MTFSEKLFYFLVLAWQFTERALWLSWVTHAIVALAIGLLTDGRTAFVVFLVREGEQLFHAAKNGNFEKWYDYPMDLVGPALVWLAL